MRTSRVITLLASLLAALYVRADDAPLRASLLKLGADDSAVRKEALLELARTGDERVKYTIGQFRLESLFILSNAVVQCGGFRTDNFAPLNDALTGQPLTDATGKQISVPADSLKKIEAGRADRKFAMTALVLVELSAPDAATRLAAVKKCGNPPPQEDALDFLSVIATNDAVKAVRSAAVESIAMIHLAQADSTVTQRIAAATTLGELKAANAMPMLRERLAAKEITPEEAAACSASLAKIESYQSKVKAFDSLKFGLSTGSILILMALGLSITFGLMGVINMAHGEMMMIGAYATYSMQLLFKHTAETPNNLYFLTAIPVAFVAAALVGGLIELLVVRHLYRRPLESLLATYGVSLILIQVCRVIFGDNRACNSPTWLVGSVELVRDMSLSYNRIFVFVLAAACLPAIWLLMNKTTIGLHMRATMQIRPMAGSVGINTRRVDTFTFMLGSGLAGIAGCALTTIGGITPDMGQNYIVDSFLVVVTGGVGQLAGVVSSGLGLGLLTKILEGTFFGTVWAKILVLTAVIAFIQYKPSGLFALKGRLADD